MALLYRGQRTGLGDYRPEIQTTHFYLCFEKTKYT